MDKVQIDIRAVPVDKLVSFAEKALASREARIVELLSVYTQRVEDLQKELEETTRLRDFLEKEQKNVCLAQLLKRGELVRVVCPKCKGTGMKPTDVTSGRDIARTGSAFEAVGGQKKTHPEDNPRLQCAHCKGTKWLLMERYKG